MTQDDVIQQLEEKRKKSAKKPNKRSNVSNRRQAERNGERLTDELEACRQMPYLKMNMDRKPSSFPMVFIMFIPEHFLSLI